MVAMAIGKVGLCGLGFFKPLAHAAVDGEDVLDEGVGVGGAEGARGGGVIGKGGGFTGVEAIVDEEGREAGGDVVGGIVREFGMGEMKVPVILEEVDGGAEGSDDGFVCVLCLAVSLGVVG